MARRHAWLIALCTVSLVATACSGGHAQNDRQANKSLVTGGTFTWGINNDFGSWNIYQNVVTLGAAQLAYDSLVSPANNGTFVPQLADKWTVTATTGTFTIKPGVTCADGTPLTATAIAAALNYVGNPKHALAAMGRIPYTAKADDQTRTVTVTMSAPDSFMLYPPYGPGALPIVCPKGLANLDGLRQRSDGSGPYILNSAVAGDHYTFSIRKGYTWGPNGATTAAPGLPAKIIMKVVTNEATMANLMLSGQVNMSGFQGVDGTRVKAAGAIDKPVSVLAGGLYYNQTPGRPGADESVRIALTQALDRDALAKVLTNNTGQPASTMITVDPKPCAANTVGGNLPSYDTAAAKKLLDQDGWLLQQDGRRSKAGKPLKLSLHYAANFGEAMASAAELIAQTWKKQLGIEVTLVGDSIAGLTKSLFQTGDWDVSLNKISYALPSDLAAYMSGPTPPQGQNFPHVDNREYLAAVAKASSLTGSSGCASWNQAEEALLRQADAVPLAVNAVPILGLHADWAQPGGYFQPTSLRMYK